MENTDWSALGFDYRKTDYNVRYSFADGKWSDMVVTDDEYIQMHMSASCLHYGIELFEGLKAFRGVDGKVRLFRVADNARRLQSSAKRLCLPVPSIEMIVDACIEVVKRNERFVPPYGTGASLYLRPVMFGTTVGLGVKPAREALLIVYCSPVGAYFKSGIKPIRVAIDREQDRAAPRGTGDVKVGGNYAASLLSGEKGHEMGYSNIMYLDAAEHKYIEERHIPVEELESFEECGACGTAAVISPIGYIYDMQTEKSYDYGDEVGKNCMELYTRLQDIQYGRAEDKYDWCTVVL